LLEVIKGEWDIRFDQVELPCLMDLNRILQLMNTKGYSFHHQQNVQVDSRLIRLLDVDIRVSLQWDADATDLGIKCLEPSGELCHAFKNHTSSGGLLSRDFTSGYGPQEYLIRRAPSGPFKLSIHLYSPTVQSFGGAVTAQVKIYTQFGRINEQEHVSVVQLTTPKETVEIGDIIVN